MDKNHEDITIDILVTLASKVMARTGSEYNSLGGNFDASKGKLRKLNVTAGAGGRSYMNWMKVPQKLEAFAMNLMLAVKHLILVILQLYTNLVFGHIMNL